MNRRDRAIELDDRIGHTLLSHEWDKAILGIGYDSHTKNVFPVYGYQVMKAMLLDKKLSARAVFHILSKLEDSGAVLLKRLNPASIWKIVREKHIPAWELMDRAAIGIYNNKLCYIEQICKDILKSSCSRLYGETDMDEKLRIQYQFDNNIKQADLGEQSPIFITVIK